MLVLALATIAVVLLTIVTLLTGHTFWVETVVVRYL